LRCERSFGAFILDRAPLLIVGLWVASLPMRCRPSVAVRYVANGTPHCASHSSATPVCAYDSQQPAIARKSLGVTQVALESTGVYWLPVVRHEALFDREGMKGPLVGRQN
jgi:hypothetical protein